MSAQIDELPGGDEGAPRAAASGGGILPLILVVVLSTGISLGGGYFLLDHFVKSKEAGGQGAGGKAIDMHPTGDEKVYEVKKLITNLSGPIKTRYISVDLVCEGYASDFEKIMEENDYRLRNEALQVLSSYGYEESQQDGFIKRVQIDLNKHFAVLLKKHRQGDGELISRLYFTEFVIQ